VLTLRGLRRRSVKTGSASRNFRIVVIGRMVVARALALALGAHSLFSAKLAY